MGEMDEARGWMMIVFKTEEERNTSKMHRSALCDLNCTWHLNSNLKSCLQTYLTLLLFSALNIHLANISLHFSYQFETIGIDVLQIAVDSIRKVPLIQAKTQTNPRSTFLNALKSKDTHTHSNNIDPHAIYRLSQI